MPDTPEVSPPLSAEELRKMDSYWRACNYLSAGMIYLRANPLLREPLKPEHIKNRLLGHWGSDPGQSLLWVHLNRLIKKYDLNVIYISGPGHERQQHSRIVIWKATIPKSIRTRAATKLACSNFLPVLLSWRNRVPLHPGNSGFDSRGRRTWIFPVPRLRRGVR